MNSNESFNANPFKTDIYSFGITLIYACSLRDEQGIKKKIVF